MPAAAISAIGSALVDAGYTAVGDYLVTYSVVIATVIEVASAIAAAPCQHRAGPATSQEASQ